MATVKLIIEYILSFILVISLMAFFVTFVAVRIRYYFLKLIGKEKSIKYLEGESDEEGSKSGGQGCFNYLIGIIVFFLIMFLIVCIFTI